LKKIIHHKFESNDKNKNKQKLYKRIREKNKDQIRKKIIYHKLVLNNEIENK
jgi:hypothetical protein